MKPLPHRYDVRLTGGPVGYATISAEGMPAMPMAPPVDFGGPGNAWSPEHLLIASVQACFLFTLRAVARHSQLTFIAVELDTSGTLDRQDGVTRFTDIVLRARVTVPMGADLDRARQAIEKSKKACLISASLLTPVRIEATLVEVQADQSAA